MLLRCCGSARNPLWNGQESTHWSSHGWRFNTCIDPSTRFQGVAVLVRISLAPEHDVQFQEVLPGRVLHVRVRLGNYSMDLVGIYQHAWTADSSKTILDRRASLWTKLGCYLSQLPTRNMLILLGDFSCVLRPLSGGTGAGLLPHLRQLP